MARSITHFRNLDVETLQKVSIVIASEKDEAEKDNAKNGKKREQGRKLILTKHAR